MKILLEESTPHKLRLLIDSRHAIVTTWFQGWSGLKNGALLDAAEEAGFDLFITAVVGGSEMAGAVIRSSNALSAYMPREFPDGSASRKLTHHL
jgi:hypothetical protein